MNPFCNTNLKLLRSITINTENIKEVEREIQRLRFQSKPNTRKEDVHLAYLMLVRGKLSKKLSKDS